MNVYARVGDAWKQADYVWCYRNGAWQLIWARLPAAPSSATATWVAPATVRIDWTPPVANPNSHWIVRRSDGSVVGQVSVDTLSLVDTRPLAVNTSTGDGTIAPYTVEGFDGSASSATAATNAVTFNLTPATLSASVAYPTSFTADVTLSWTPNAASGAPQGWQAYIDGVGFVGSVLPGSATSTMIAGQFRGVAPKYRIVPMTQKADGTWVQAGNVAPLTVQQRAADPANVSLYVVGLSNLRLGWAHPAGSGRSGYEVQRYISSWEPHAMLDANALASDWATTQAGYMRVRTLSAGGPSDWVQVGPVAPVNDNTGPGPSTISSWKPEASYGRMVARGNFSADADTATGQVFFNTGGGWVSVWGPAGITPNQAFAIVAGTGSNGQNVSVLVRTWDANGNINTADRIASYTLAAGTAIIAPTDGYTSRNGAWRDDGVATRYSLLQGDTSSGRNTGTIFYGDQVSNYLVGRTYQGGWMEAWRVNDQGSGLAIQPGLVAHPHGAKQAAPPPISDNGQQTLGNGLARTGTTSGTIPIPTGSGVIALLQSGWKGLGLHRADATSTDPSNPNSRYMKFGDTGATQPGGSSVMGRLVLTSWG